MRKYVGPLLILLPAVLLLAAFATSAFAAHPHFVAASVALQGQNLVVTSQESGLGNTRWASLNYSYTGSVTETYLCGTVQKPLPSAQIPTSSSTFLSHNGTVKLTNSSLALPVLTSPCAATDTPNTLIQISVNVTVTDQSNNNVNISTSGTFPVPH